MSDYSLYCGDCIRMLKTLPDQSIQCCVTSPPYYGLRDYKVNGQIGLEETPEAYVAKLVAVFQEVRRVLRDDGTLWLNLGDSYGGNREHATESATATCGNTVLDVCAKFNKVGNGVKSKDLIGIPWMVAFALRADGWYLRSDIIWAKPNPMPESVKDRPTKSHEYLFLLSKNKKYYYDYRAILELANYDGRKDTKFKGSLKYDDETLARVGGERWPNKIKNLQPNGQQTNTMHINRANGLGEPRGYGLDEPGFNGHSGNYDAEGNLLTHEKDGAPARNKRDVWWISTKPFNEAHFAVFPEKLIEPCVYAGSKKGDTILDPFSGSGTTGVVSIKNERNYIGIDLNQAYIEMSEKRIKDAQQQMRLPL